MFGVNPSKANEEESDPTITRVITTAACNGYNTCLMLNLYPLRNKNPDELPEHPDKDLVALKYWVKYGDNSIIAQIKDIQKKEKSVDILLAFGGCIKERDYLKTCFEEIVKKIKEIKPCYKVLALTQDGFPAHPISVGRYRKDSKIIELTYKDGKHRYKGFKIQNLYPDLIKNFFGKELLVTKP